MDKARKFCVFLLGSLSVATGCSSTETFHQVAPPPNSGLLAPVSPSAANPANSTTLPHPPAAQPDERPLPINLPTALKLANVRAIDIAAASQQIQVATALLEKARVLWLPTVTVGADYFRHDGPVQDNSGDTTNNSHSSFMLGAGSAVGQAAVISVDDAIYAPLYAKQQVRARQANLQAASNDTLVAVSDAYFTVQQSRGEAAGAVETTRRTKDLVSRTRKLAPAVVPELELYRAEAELARREQSELLARERWKVSSAELARLLLLDSMAQIAPVEAPHLKVELIDPKKTLEDLIPVGLTYRPELASQQAQVQATIALLKQERMRPWIPNVVLRGASTNPAGTLAAGGFFPTPNGSEAGMRADIDLQLLWQLDNLGFGNTAKIHQREAENRAASIELTRIELQVARDVAQAYAQAQMAARRIEAAERGLRAAIQSADKNFEALSQTKAIGNQFVPLVRPQEVVASIQALSQAYIDYYGAVADTNRAQFRLYRALGQPAQYLAHDHPIENCDSNFPAPAIPSGAANEELPAPNSNLPLDNKSTDSPR